MDAKAASVAPSSRSAAPEMCEALEEARDTIAYLRQYVAGQGLSAEGDCDDAIRTIDDALSKAKRQQRSARDKKGRTMARFWTLVIKLADALYRAAGVRE